MVLRDTHVGQDSDETPDLRGNVEVVDECAERALRIAIEDGARQAHDVAAVARGGSVPSMHSSAKKKVDPRSGIAQDALAILGRVAARQGRAHHADVGKGGDGGVPRSKLVWVEL